MIFTTTKIKPEKIKKIENENKGRWVIRYLLENH